MRRGRAGGTPTARTQGAGTSLAARQSELVETLVAGGPLPQGFDATRIDTARRALLRKRAGEAAKVWPLLEASLGPGWARTFAETLVGREPAGALRDGWDVARTLHRRGKLSVGARTELARREAAYRYDGLDTPRPRRAVVRRVVAMLARRH